MKENLIMVTNMDLYPEPDNHIIARKICKGLSKSSEGPGLMEFLESKDTIPYSPTHLGDILKHMESMWFDKTGNIATISGMNKVKPENWGWKDWLSMIHNAGVIFTDNK